MLNLSGFSLTFDDEFNGLSVSQNGSGTVWSDIRPGSRLGPNTDIGFGDSAFVDAGSGIDPFSLQNGALQITAVPDNDPSIVGGAQWASGLIDTLGSFSQEYGYFEYGPNFLPVPASGRRSGCCQSPRRSLRDSRLRSST
jgi:hypothetical protein